MEETLTFKTNSNLFNRILYFPLVQIIIAIIVINIPTFIFRSVAQLILSFLNINNDTVSAVLIFCVRLLTVYYAYYYFVKVVEKRKANEVLINYISLKEFSIGLIFGIMAISVVMTIMLLTGNFKIYGISDSANLFQSFLYHYFSLFYRT